MPDTANTPTVPAAGQQGAPDPAEAMLAAAMADMNGDPKDADGGQQNDEQGSSTPWTDPESARREIERLRRENAGWRTKLREVEPIVEQWRQLEEASKTDLQRLEERATAAERERDELRAQAARLRAAAEFGIPADLVDLLGTGDDEQIKARAKVLAERLGAAQAAPPRVRPVEALRSGAAPSSDGPPDANAWFRGFLSSARNNQ